MRKMLLCCLLAAAACKGEDSLADLGAEEDLAPADVEDMREPRDFGEVAAVDARMDVADLAMCRDPGKACAGPGTLCDQTYQCLRCGNDGQECCANNVSDRVCDPGFICVSCSPNTWGKDSRCQPEACGLLGKSCCWKWDLRPEMCGLEPPKEWCIEGGCIAHRCSK